jgi:hypothetical protein
MLSPEEAVAIRDQFTLMKFFPSDPAARAALSRLLQRMCGSFDHAQWLVDRALEVYSEWPGSSELRALYCSHFKPQDGIEVDSTIFPNGFVNGRPAKDIDQAPQHQIEAGEPVSADLEFDQVVDVIAPAKTLNFFTKKPKVTNVRDDESEYSALVRAIGEEQMARDGRMALPPSEAEIESIKRQQAECAKEDTTRQILQALSTAAEEEQLTPQN